MVGRNSLCVVVRISEWSEDGGVSLHLRCLERRMETGVVIELERDRPEDEKVSDIQSRAA